ncbi:hypothetical protein [Psychroserpens ponticola]|uniref:Uncharacterized protein n=1 Tax=Psychroserpens ponticola TaxID=2932268 RepID=A0ABY7RYY5_9FLAO|nr:hypothetical protein [Psychroserpens ponticola]WCO02272.1 hypothetical protein MUN68_001990 [Psychroserpens ponticola]
MKLSKISMALICFPLLLMNTQCDEDDDFQVRNCGQTVIIDNAFYESAISGDYALVGFEIIEDCLTIEVSASGCDGESWSMVLVDSGAVAESSPEQRYLKFVFTNEEACLAVFSQSRVFDLSGLRVDGSNEIVLNIEGVPDPINYLYP